MMATAYFFEELVSEICSFHRIELCHRHRALLYEPELFRVNVLSLMIITGDNFVVVSGLVPNYISLMIDETKHERICFRH